MDGLEELIRNHGRMGPTAITPPETEYDLRTRRSSIDREHPNAQDPAEPVATEAAANNLPYRLHKAADVPFLFPKFLREGLSLPALPFPTIHCRTLPATTPREIDRYHFLFCSV